MLKINVITLFPNLFKEHLANLPFKKALKSELLQINLINLRNFALDTYGTVDDKPYGGGVGMVLMIEPIYNALASVFGPGFEINNKEQKNGRIITMSPRGKPFNQNMAKELSKEQQITLICGRYEGIDARVEQHLSTDVVSIGDFVLSGGELPALAILEALTRLLPGVLEKSEAAELESFSRLDYIEYPQYTRPEEFRGLKVPEVLLSGNHQAVSKWREIN